MTTTLDYPIDTVVFPFGSGKATMTFAIPRSHRAEALAIIERVSPSLAALVREGLDA